MTARDMRTGECGTFRGAWGTHDGRVVRRASVAVRRLLYLVRLNNAKTMVAGRSRLTASGSLQEATC